MGDHPDHHDRPLPFENLIGGYPHAVGGYRSTAVQVDNVGVPNATKVRVTWSMSIGGGAETWEEKTVDSGKKPTLFFVNQGDVLTNVETTDGGGSILDVFESNQLPLAPRTAGVIPYAFAGSLSVVNGGLRWYAPADGSITLVHASVGTAPSGSGTTVRVNRNGSSIGSVTISAGNYSASFVPGSPGFSAGDYFTVDVTAAGGASDLVVHIRT
jgi:hypothetical protein